VTVHATTARVRPGDRVALQGAALRDGTFRATRLRVLAHVRHALVRGVVIRRLAHATLLATGRSVIRVRHAARTTASAHDDGELRAGAIGDFRIRFDDDGLVAEHVDQVGQAGSVRIEGGVVSLSPFIVSLEGLPVTITVPAGITLPAGLAVGQRLELTVQVGAGNVFTLVAIDEVENENPAAAPGQEVEVRGAVVTSTASEIVVSTGKATFTFEAPAGVTLPILAPGTRVEARGVSRNGVITLERLRLDDSGDGGDDGGGHDGH
jgi:hypothetical protein